MYSSEEVTLCSKRVEDAEYARRLTMEMAFKMLTSSRPELIAQAAVLLPATKLNTVNDNGHTALTLACINGDECAVAALLDAGADLNVESPAPASNQAGGSPSKGAKGSPVPKNSGGQVTTPVTKTPNNLNSSNSSGSSGSNFCCAQNGINAETQHWTALTYTALLGNCTIARMLLERGAAVEGGAKLSEDKCTVTPLQVATAVGNHEMVALLLAHGAQPFLSTLIKDTFCYSGSAQRGCYRYLYFGISRFYPVRFFEISRGLCNGRTFAVRYPWQLLTVREPLCISFFPIL